MRKNDLSVFKMESEGVKITLKRGNDYQPMIHAAPMGVPVALPSPVAVPPAGPADSAPKADKLHEITSPMVGTYYGSPAPDAQPYVKVGMEIQEDTVVCIVEAMKVMNEIKAEVKGVITQIIVESAKPVEFGQPMFKVRPL